MKKTNKKGFTIVELVIVIAVIAILSAVLIPTFSGIVKKAKYSADQKAVTEMNKILATQEISEANIFLAYDALAENGMDAQDYKALSKGMDFFWDAVENRVLLVENGVAVYPKEFEGKTDNGQWFSLAQKIEKEEVAISSGSATVAKAEQLAYVVDQANNGSAVNSVSFGGAKVNMAGAPVTIDEVKASAPLTISNGTIENATAVEAKKLGANTNTGNDGIYNMAMITKVAKNATVTLDGITIKNMNMKDTDAGNCGFLVGELSGKLILKNVTIENSSIIGYTSVGALVGYMTSGGSIEIQGTLTLKNVSVQGVGGRIGQLIGYADNAIAGKITLAEGASVVMTNVTNTIYNCEQNTGSCAKCGKALGLNGNLVDSWQVAGDGELECAHAKTNRVFNANSLIGYASAQAGADYNATLKTILGL